MLFAALLNLWFLSAYAQVEPNWGPDAVIDEHIFPNGRSNIYQWDEAVFAEKVKRGQNHALHYPVEVTGLLLPARPMLRILDAKPGDPLFALMKTIFAFSKDFKDFKGFWEWMGLTPPAEGSGEKYPMGVSIVQRNGVDGFTMSCAACHSASLFGRPVLGMTNRFPRANLFFMHGQQAMAKVSPGMFALATGASRGEKEMYRESAEHVKSIGVKKPVALGLDTSISQVALSLAKRAPTASAERTEYDANHPRSNELDTLVADSKPAVWWNVKYKTRWLSDGSIVSGNPVFTNFLWNEIGRGVDLPELIQWLDKNNATVRELTTAVFATEAPKWRDFFGESSISVERAKRGEILYAQNCAHCHGSVTKAWSISIDTIRLKYEEKVRDVGTDPGRRKGMKAMAEALNPLEFSRSFGIVVEEQAGYVPPPLVGIWARYPYLHNNSIPSLCALMMAPAARPVTYYSGKAIDRDRDYDQECMGYPLGERVPAEWKTADSGEHLYDTRLQGLSNAGHYERIFVKDGVERYSTEEKKDLLEFLKTL